VKPLVAYHGGKGRLAEWIVGLLPPHRIYIEPFAGSAAVLLAKPVATHEILNDLDRNAVTFYRVLRDRPEDLELACRLTPYARDEFLAGDLHDDGISDLEWARRWWLRTSQSFNHTAGRQTGWATSVNRGSNSARTVLNRLERFAPAVERLSHVVIENRDAVDVITQYSKPDAVIYADPPYLMSARTSMTKRPNGDYLHEFSTVEQHERLATALKATPATVLLSGYDSPLYAELYDGWHRTGRRVLRRSSNGRSASQVHVNEVIWSNRPLSEDLFSGSNAIEEIA
jgi:DNA adenine methylase